MKGSGSSVYALAMFMFILGWIVGYLTAAVRDSREKARNEEK